MDLRQCGEYREFMRQLGWMVEGVGGRQMGYVKRLPFFPILSVMKVQRVDDQIDFSRIDEIARRYRAMLVKVEPKLMQNAKIKNKNDNRKFINNIKRFGYKQDRTSLLATKTRIIDLGQSEKKLLSGMKGKTRYNVGLAKRRGVTTRIIDGKELSLNSALVDGFYQVLRENSRRIKILTYPRRWFEKLVGSFGKNCFVIFASGGDKDQASGGSSSTRPRKLRASAVCNAPAPVDLEKSRLVGAALFLVAGGATYYSHNGTTEKGRKNMTANLMMWEGIREAKKRRCKWFDVDGVYDGRYTNTKNWQGFSRFKEGFGGQEVAYLGSFIKWLPFLR